MAARSPFSASADGMPNLGQGRGWTMAAWRTAPRRPVPVARLVATNRGHYLNPSRVAHYSRRGIGRGDICVIEHGGRFYIADGHHRAAAAIGSGATTITARVMKVGGSR